MTWEDILKEKDYKFGPKEYNKNYVRIDEPREDKREERIMEQRKQQALKIAEKTTLMLSGLARTIKNINITSTNKEDLTEFLDDLQEIIELTAQSWESKNSTDMRYGEIPDIARGQRKTEENFADMNRELSSKLDRFRKGE